MSIQSIETQFGNGAVEKTAAAGITESSPDAVMAEIRELLTQKMDPSEPEEATAARQVIADHLEELQGRHPDARDCAAYVLAYNLANPNKRIAPKAAPFKAVDFPEPDSILAFLKRN